MDVIHLDENNFDSVINSDVPVLVDFWAAWCAPCMMIAPTIEKIAEESDGTYKIAKLNVDENSKIAGTYNIMSIPTLGIFKNGKMVDSMIGVAPKQQILDMIKKHY
ncbi:MAG: thioredoxin [Candidatus Cloacimonadota bacterium]|nr:MAG: thioredoxin [Candidatus Cloacimonadota bacterium]